MPHVRRLYISPSQLGSATLVRLAPGPLAKRLRACSRQGGSPLSALDAELLDILVCPESKQSLREVDTDLLARVNAAIEAGSVANRGGDAVQKPLETALVRDDGSVLYPVRDGIPVMLLDEAILIDSLDA